MRTVIGSIVADCPLTDQITNYRILLKFGANINRRDKYKLSALHAASINGHLEMVDLLLEFGAEKEQSTS